MAFQTEHIQVDGSLNIDGSIYQWNELFSGGGGGGGTGDVAWASGNVGSNNQIITAAGDGSIVAESNLSFDGNVLSITGNLELASGAGRSISVGGTGSYGLTISGGSGASNIGGDVSIHSGDGSIYTGNIYIEPIYQSYADGSGGDLYLSGGKGNMATSKAGDVYILGGKNDTAGPGDGGDVYIERGGASGYGVRGNIYIGQTNGLPTGTPDTDQILFVDTADNYKLKRGTAPGGIASQLTLTTIPAANTWYPSLSPTATSGDKTMYVTPAVYYDSTSPGCWVTPCVSTKILSGNLLFRSGSDASIGWLESTISTPNDLYITGQGNSTTSKGGAVTIKGSNCYSPGDLILEGGDGFTGGHVIIASGVGSSSSAGDVIITGGTDNGNIYFGGDNGSTYGYANNIYFYAGSATVERMTLSSTQLLSTINVKAPSLTSTGDASISGTIYGDLTGTADVASVASTITVEAIPASSTWYPTMAGSSTPGDKTMYMTSGFNYNSNTSTLTSSKFAGDLTGDVTGTADKADQLYINNDDGVDINCPILFSATSTAGYKAVYEDSALYFDNSTNILYSSSFSGYYSGTAGLTWLTVDYVNIDGNIIKSGTSGQDLNISGADWSGGGSNLLVRGGHGSTGSTADGGHLTLKAGDGGASSGGVGGDVSIGSGDGYVCGDIYIEAASGFDAGDITLTPGNGSTLGNLYLTGGAGHGNVFLGSRASGADYATNVYFYAGSTSSRMTLSSTALTSAVRIGIPSGTAALPSLYFTDDGDTGFYRYSTDDIGVSGSTDLEFLFQMTGGTFHAEGDIIAYSSTVSDRRLKDNIKTLESSKEFLMKLDPVSFNWKHKKEEEEWGEREHYGFIAQEVEKLNPNFISENKLPFYADEDNQEKEYKIIRNENFVPFLVGGFKEHEVEISELRKTIDKQQKQIDDLKTRMDILMDHLDK